MTTDSKSRSEVRTKIREVLVGLSLEEQRLFSEVIRVEGSWLHVDKLPKAGRDDLIKAVKQVVR